MFYRLLSFFLHGTVLKLFFRVFLKKTLFFEKTCGFYTYFEIEVWLQRGSLKNDIPSFGCNLYDFCWYKSFFLILKNIFLKFWINYTHVAHFLCFVILAKWSFCRNFNHLIFILFLLHLDFSTLFFQIFLLKWLNYLAF